MRVKYFCLKVGEIFLSKSLWNIFVKSEIYFQVVLQRANLRNGEEEESEGEGQMFQLQLAQLVGVAVLLCAMYVNSVNINLYI